MADKAASVLAKIRNKAKASGISYQQCLQLFVQEEFLRKLSKSGYGDTLILKGGLFIYTLTNFESRATIDVDFLLRGYPNSIEDIKDLIGKIINTPTGNDYIEMRAKGFEEISPQRKYHGISTQIIAQIKNVRVPFNIDIGVGDIIFPRAEERKISTQLPDFEAPIIKTYSLESTIAEKFDAILQRFELTGRMKDFYDIYYLSRTFNFDEERLQSAIFNTLQRRGTPYDRDMNSDYGDGANPVILKSEFILSLCEQLIGGSSLGAKQKSIIDRCTASVYRYYQQGNYMGTPPTLQDFREELLKQDEPEAQEIALAIELFTDGSLNTFAKHTNVDTHSRLICYDILDLCKQLQPIGMLVVLDSILNRITQNRAKGRNTFIFIDEIYLLFQHEYSANFLFKLWKRVRKYGAYCTGITQNVDDLLQSHTARTMLANSEFIIMLNQASTDRIELAKLLNISDLQLSYITNVGAGQGLLKVGSSLVPFVNKFPRNTELYKLMTTKFGEV